MRLIHNMTTIAECPAPENSPLGRVIKMAVIGGSGVGKTGKTKNQKKTAVVEGFSLRARVWKIMENCSFLSCSAGGEIPDEALHRGL